MTPAAIIITAALLIAAVWLLDLYVQDLKQYLKARRDLRRHKRQARADKALIAECFAESQMWEQRRLERERRLREREERRAA